MTNTEKRLSNIETALLKLMEKKPTAWQKLWNRIKPHIIPFILGMIFGGLLTQSIPFVQTSLEHQAALGGAAIPFPSGKPSPSLSALLPSDWNEEKSDSSLTSTSALLLPDNQQADAGQAASTKLFRRLVRPIP
jgi:hypothetical protein